MPCQETVSDRKGHVGLALRSEIPELIAKCLEGAAKALSNMGPSTHTQREKEVHRH